MLAYRLLIIFLSPVILLYFLWGSLRNQQPRYFWQRTGLSFNKLPSNALWIHCASVGEVITVMPLVNTIIQNRSARNQLALPIIITTNTVTGAKIVRQQQLENLHHTYLPFDWGFAVKAFLHQLKPVALFVVETEIWPNLFYYCHKNQCPVTLINARLSIKTTQARPWIKAIIKTTLQYADAIYTRSEMDLSAFKEIGADKYKLHFGGNLKFCKKPEPARENIIKIHRDYMLAASTHHNEELQISERWFKLNRSELLFLAPRHPERCSAITRQLKQLNPQLNIAVHSQHHGVDKNTDVYILDTVGELIHYFAEAKLVIMGGSFVPIGGHNILEPAQFGCAIICGPYMNNFSDEKELLLAKNALLQLSSMDELESTLKQLLADDQRRSQLAENAKRVSQGFNHIVTTYVQLIEAVIH